MNHYRPSFDEFAALATGRTRVPVYATLLADELTPVSAFARLDAAAGGGRAFLLESVVGGESVARYSFVGADPVRTLCVRGDSVEITDHAPRTAVHPRGSGAAQRVRTTDPLAVLRAQLAPYRAASLPELPHFLGGLVGYAGYDTIRYYERLGDGPPDDRDLPVLSFDLYESLVIFDHARKTVLVVGHADVSAARDRAAQRSAYEAASAGIDRVVAALRSPSAVSPVPIDWPSAPATTFSSNFERATFEAAVRNAQEYIRSGDIFQVVISQRLSLATAARPLDIYRALRVVNPSPFMFYLRSPEVTLVGSSPEILCRVEHGVVTNRPLAGTRPRGATPADDERLGAELLNDPKERAEHIMLVDLGRNDVGRVCRPGSVRIPEVMNIEQYSHVMHISSTVTGDLAEGMTAFDALRATLPVGTVSGAPKVRAMQIIDELEPTRRGPYAGAVGYVDFSGDMDTCIALRTIVLTPLANGRSQAYVQAGAGIVADSDPAREYEETLNKARGPLAAIALAERSFA
ncbi:MAG: anthranilate synthase component I [Phycisphaerae bacterium]